MSYNFIYDQDLVRKTEKLFISEHEDSLFTTFLAYRFHKAKDLGLDKKMDLPLKDLWHSKILYPSRVADHKLVPIEHILEKSIERNFHRPLGAFDPFEHPCNLPLEALAVYLSVDPKSPQKALYALVNELTQLALSSTYLKANHEEKLNKIIYTPIERQMVTVLDSDRKHAWFHFETDTKEDVFPYLKSVLVSFSLEDPITIETAHGYHFLWPMKVVGNKRYKELTCALFDKCPEKAVTRQDRRGAICSKVEKLFTLHQNGRIPVPGTLQYGFRVKFVDIPTGK